MKSRPSERINPASAREAHDHLKAAARLLAEGGFRSEASLAKSAVRRVESALRRGKRRFLDTYAVEVG